LLIVKNRRGWLDLVWGLTVETHGLSIH
jgi:hypothetical protein